MEDELHLTGSRYNVALTVFFVSYGLLEVPSNIILKMMRPSRWIAILMFSVCTLIACLSSFLNGTILNFFKWGLVMTLMGIVQSYKGLYVARFALGVAEAGFFPAASYLLTIWYAKASPQR